MPWWGWVILGLILLGSELLLIDAGFYLVFIGIAAALTGFVVLADLGLELWHQWILFSALALVLMVLFRKKLYAKLRGAGIGYETGPAGEIVTLEAALEPGASSRMAYRGTDWTIVNDSGQAFSAGQRARITRVDGLTLRLDKVTEH